MMNEKNSRLIRFLYLLMSVVDVSDVVTRAHNPNVELSDKRLRSIARTLAMELVDHTPEELVGSMSSAELHSLSIRAALREMGEKQDAAKKCEEMLVGGR
jgi:hypothetical protein